MKTIVKINPTVDERTKTGLAVWADWDHPTTQAMLRKLFDCTDKQTILELEVYQHRLVAVIGTKKVGE
jgi:hypothetical protein